MRSNLYIYLYKSLHYQICNISIYFQNFKILNGVKKVKNLKEVVSICISHNGRQLFEFSLEKTGIFNIS